MKAARAAERSALESIRWAIGSRTDVEPTFRMRPQRRSRIPGSTARTSAIGASTSDRCAASHSSRENASGSGPAGGPPVLHTSTSTGPPRASSTDETRPGTASRSALSQTSPVAPIASAAEAIRSFEREVIATRAPSAASAAAMARPMPAEAPVTRATRPFSPRSTGPP